MASKTDTGRGFRLLFSIVTVGFPYAGLAIGARRDGIGGDGGSIIRLGGEVSTRYIVESVFSIDLTSNTSFSDIKLK